MQRAVSNFPSICIETMGKPLQNLLDPGSQVSLLQQLVYDRCLAHLLGPANSELAGAHNLFTLTAASDESLPITRYIQLDVTFLGLVVPMVRLLVVKTSNTLTEDKRKAKLPGIVGWNLVRLAYEEFVKKYGDSNFDQFNCPASMDPLLFSQLCMFHYMEVRKPTFNEIHEQGQIYMEFIATNSIGEVVSKKPKS